MASEKMSLPHIFIGLGIALQLERKLTVVMKQKGGGLRKQVKLHKLPWAKQILEGEDGKEKAKATAK